MEQPVPHKAQYLTILAPEKTSVSRKTNILAESCHIPGIEGSSGMWARSALSA